MRPIHAKAMPVLLTTPEKWDVWLSAPLDEALALQRLLPNQALMIGAKGEKTTKHVPLDAPRPSLTPIRPQKRRRRLPCIFFLDMGTQNALVHYRED